MNSFESKDYTITQFLGRAANYQIRVPANQRGYSWEKKHCSALWEDVVSYLDTKKANRPYFLGPVVYIRSTDHSQMLLLDGQQRLATLTILLSEIRDIAYTLGDNGKKLWVNIQRDFIAFENDDGEKKPALLLSSIDQPFFEKAIQEDVPDRKEPKALTRSHRLLSAARAFLGGKLKEHIKDKTPTEALKLLNTVHSVLTKHFTIVAISVTNESEAYQIFETLNDRGLRLSPADLLLNYLVSRASSNDDRAAIRSNWDELLKKLGNRQPSQFLRWMWISTHGDVKSESLYAVIRRHIEDVKITPADFAAECLDECERFLAIQRIDKKFFKGTTGESLTGLVNYYGADRCIPLLMSALKVFESDPDGISRVVALCEIITTRQAIITAGDPSPLETALYASARTLRVLGASGKPKTQRLAAVRAELKKVDPTDEAVVAQFKVLNFENERTAQFFIRRLCRHLQSNKLEIFDEEQISLEHIFPENAAIAQWPHMDEMQPLIWHVGNLSLLEKDLNSDAGNKAFKAKKNYYKNSLVKDANALSKLDDLWTAKSIVQRAANLSAVCTKLWPAIKA